MRIQAHMKHVPKYLLPRVAPVSGEEEGDSTTSNSTKPKVGFVPFRKPSSRRHGRGGKSRGGASSGGRKKSDPLKIFR